MKDKGISVKKFVKSQIFMSEGTVRISGGIRSLQSLIAQDGVDQPAYV